MAIECPLSCGICTHECNDTDTSCGAWATAGECEANPEAMLRLCPTSCGLCTPECYDLDKECTAWGAAGECNTNPEFMIRKCPVTCEACKSTCKDIQQDCPGWTADGECFKNPGFMCAAAAAAAAASAAAATSPPSPRVPLARGSARRSLAASLAPASRSRAACQPCPCRTVSTAAPSRVSPPAPRQVQGVPAELRRVRGRHVRRQKRDAVRDLGRRRRVHQQPARGDEGVPRLVRRVLDGVQQP